MTAALTALLRELAPRVMTTILRRYRDFAASEDAVQEALVAAALRWPADGVPANPRAWLTQVAARRITDHVRAETARRLRESLVVSLVPADEQIALAADEATAERDDTLDLLFMCCHPSLSPASAIALTLRAVGGLTTAEIAAAWFVPEATMAQRLSRAKQTIKASGVGFASPDAAARAARLGAVMHVLYLMFNEGYTATTGSALQRVDLSDEALRLARMLATLTDEPEVLGLCALMLLTDARRAARVGPSGELVPLDEQDRATWDRAAIAEGTRLVDAAFARGRPGPYQIQAAIAALHDEAPSTDATDWRQILALYEVLLALDPTAPMVRLSRAIALAMVDGPAAGLAALDALAADPRLATHHRWFAARGHLLERLGDRVAARDAYLRAAEGTRSAPERDYLVLRAARLGERATG